MAQQGSLFESHGAWYVRYRIPEKQADGSVATVQRAQRIASKRDYPKKSEVVPLKNEFMAKLNRVGFTPDAGIRLEAFVENSYFPAMEKRLKPSTIRGYREAWRCHIQRRVRHFRLRDFRTVDGEKLMADIEREYGTNLAHGTYSWIKVTLSAIFTHARRQGVIDGVNPMQGVSVPKGKKHGRRRLAYSLEEIEKHLELFSTENRLQLKKKDGSDYRPEVSAKVVRAIIGTAAFAGLREGELRGLWWDDDDGHVFNIQRSVWRSHVGDTKTGEDEEDAGVVPIISPLRSLLDAIRPEEAYGFMFRNRIEGALDLDNLADRIIKPVLKLNGLVWKGWHAYRRGLATNLKRLGVEDVVIQAILRHEDVSTTQRSYIKMVRPDVDAAMKRLEAKIGCAADVQQQALPN
jgi:integrase